MKKNKAETYNSQEIDKIFESILPEEADKIEKKMLLASKIDDAMKTKGWKNKDLLNVIGKSSPSLITKWLSGTHNFTIDTLIDLERALDIKLLNLEEDQEKVAVKYHVEIVKTVSLNYTPVEYLNEIISGNKPSNEIFNVKISRHGSLTKKYAEA